VSSAQEKYVISDGMKTKSTASDIAKGCEDNADPEICSKQKLSDIMFEALRVGNTHNIVKNTKKDTIFVKTRLSFDTQKNLDTIQSFIKIYQIGEKNPSSIQTSFSVNDLDFQPSKRYTNKVTNFENLLAIKIDRKEQELILISASGHNSKKVEVLKERYAIYLGCEHQETYAVQKKCFDQKFRNFIHQNFDNNIPKKLKLKGKFRMIVAFTIDEEGRIQNIRSRASHPQFNTELKRILQSFPKVKPALTNGKPTSVTPTIPLIFTWD
jgi:hypothetical protein